MPNWIAVYMCEFNTLHTMCCLADEMHQWWKTCLETPQLAIKNK